MKCPLILVVALASVLWAQRPSFEVAAIKPMGRDATTMGVTRSTGGQFEAQNCTVRMLLEYAYGLLPFQIAGGPDWIGSAKYSVAAKGDASATNAEVRLMLQSLLAERFHLIFHYERPDKAIYTLVQNGKHNMTPAVASTKRGNSIKFDGPGSMLMEIRNTPMDRLAAMLSGELQAIVEDRTELIGGFSFELNLSPEAAATIPIAPALSQVGLKLESRKGPVQVLVVDRAEKPGEN